MVDVLVSLALMLFGVLAILLSKPLAQWNAKFYTPDWKPIVERSMSLSMQAGGVLFILFGLWLFLDTLVGMG